VLAPRSFERSEKGEGRRPETRRSRVGFGVWGLGFLDGFERARGACSAVADLRAAHAAPSRTCSRRMQRRRAKIINPNNDRKFVCRKKS
jgi:hypothetical protein